ncbi:MAG: sensor histidine kinase [bacterium]
MGPWGVPIVLSVSIFLQLASAVTALLLIRVSGYLKPWLFISVAIVLMAIRRIISLRNIVVSGVVPASALGPELVALVISILMLTGLVLLQPTFRAIRRIQADSERRIAEGQLMVRESHHHIKNDLQMLAGLVRMQINSLPGGASQDLLRDVEMRVRSFAMLHDEIYSAGGEGIDVAQYIERLARAIHAAFTPRTSPIALELDVHRIDADRKDMLYCGLLLNEALTNAYKHAFPAGAIAEPRIVVSLRAERGRGVLEVRDNGVGIPPDACEDASSSYGLSLIRAVGEGASWRTRIVSPAAPAESGQTASGGPGTSVVMEL